MAMAEYRCFKIVWFLTGNPERVASSRIQGYNIHRKLTDLGYRSILSYAPAYVEENIPFQLSDKDKFATYFRPGDIVLLQKIKDESNIPFVKFLSDLGVRVFLIDCDLPISPGIAKLTESVICGSKFLTELYDKSGIPAIYIEDCPESFSPPREVLPNIELKCYWFGDGSTERWKDVLKLRQILASDERLKQWRLITISNHPDADIVWTPGFLDELKDADAVALPVFNTNEGNMVKSANRLLQSMALSIPVVCSPLRSYLDVIDGNECGIICKSEADWINAFIRLKDFSLRTKMSRAAFDKAKEYDIDKSIYSWIESLKLDKNFLATNRKEEVKEEENIHQFYYRKLLKRNINYWSKRQSSLYNWLLFLCLKGKIFFQRF
jgi:hypothetical protein